MNTQTLLILVISLLTINLLFVGVYIVLVLKEVRETMQKFNSILDTTKNTFEAVTEPLVGVSNAVSGFTQGLKIVNFVKALRSGGSSEEKGEKED